ncbi:MAG: RHS repeat-associated core domain-containing protein [Bdellovibrionota bacterium]|nr:RHS repeat-associated core domain-containing protein [Bdellovibrionota bacterium]MEC8625139.1 RHS repeat-associated core domain-containing protein [Bdellovibrionota bacterium]
MISLACVREIERVEYWDRNYNPSTGTFISEDPLGFQGRDSNLYRYVVNHPMNYKDPSGKFLHVAVGALLGGATSAIFAALSGQDGGKAFLSGFIVGGLTALLGPAGGAIGNGLLELYTQIVNRKGCDKEIKIVPILISTLGGFFGGKAGKGLTRTIARAGRSRGLTGPALKDFISARRAAIASWIGGVSQILNGLIGAVSK